MVEIMVEEPLQSMVLLVVAVLLVLQELFGDQEEHFQILEHRTYNETFYTVK
jgi:hypothetical protein